uniref:Fatty acyl-CoA reductase n=1 Tax=Ostrinia scapulalis TaxID=99575 RepID=B6SDC3_OSTSC|nr:FAR-like protein XIII [Ostrinia scapulalis]
MSANTMETDEQFTDNSPIVNFYSGKSVFVTGATGFLGTVLVEKLLFSCKGINNIYILIKQTEDLTIEARILNYLNSKAFHRVKNTNPELMKKIIPICGNLEDKNLGISDSDMKTLLEEVSIVFHVAAKLLFKMSLTAAVNINTKPTEQLIAICKKMRRNPIFIYVSSAYSNVNEQIIDEKVYNTGVPLETIYDTLDTENTRITDIFLDKRPNTYTYSKALAEVVVEKEFDESAAIVRPSIIVSSIREPIPGWLSGSHGFPRVVGAACKGLLLRWHGDGTVVCDLIPVDHVANLIIAAAWESNERRLMGNKGVKVYNCCSSLRNPIDVITVVKTCIKYRKYFGTRTMSIFTPRFIMKKNYFIYKLLYFTCHTIPAAIIDGFFWLTGRTPIMLKTLDKLSKISSVLEYFTHHQFIFLDSNVRGLLRRMEGTDRQTFNFDVTEIEWEPYLQNFVRGIANNYDYSM